MAALAQVYETSIHGDVENALRAIAQFFPRQTEAIELKRRTLGTVARSISDMEVAGVLPLLSQTAFELLPSELTNVLKSFGRNNPRSLAESFTALRGPTSSTFTPIVMDALATSLSQNDFEWISEALPELFNSLLLERPAIAYQPQFWNWNFTVFEKVDIFRLLLEHLGIDKKLLFDALFSSADPELLSRLVGDLSSEQLPQVLQWIQHNEQAVTSLEWTSFFRNHAQAFVNWLNTLVRPDLQIVILAANVLDAPPPLHDILTEESIERLALAVPKLPPERHEVAAFLFVTTAWVHRPTIATIFIQSSVSLHKAIAQNRLSNRAWQLLKPILAPLPNAEWDSCEKLRRATLHFMAKNGWDYRILARHFEDDIDLFYDFTRTAKSFDEGRKFMARIYDAAQKSELSLGKKQVKELRKLLGKSFFW
jgi:hypothetical protein